MTTIAEAVVSRVLVPTGAGVPTAAEALGASTVLAPVTVGTVGKITVQYDPALGTKGLQLAQQFLNYAQTPYSHMEYYFGVTGGNVTAVVANLGTAHDGSAGASHGGCDFASGGTLSLDATFNNANPIQMLIALFVAELSECFMGAQNKGWGCGSSNGEGLSRFLAEYETQAGTLAAFATGPSWAASRFANWVDKTEGTDRNAVSTGCAVVYLYYVRSLGFTISQIVQAGGATLHDNYKNLTGRNDAYAMLTAALAGLSISTDNPFGRPAEQPALVAYGSKLFMAWKGLPSDEGIYWSTFDGTSWAPQQRIPGVGTGSGPSAAVVGNTLYLAWKGVEGDSGIWWSTFNGTTWTPQRNVPGVGTSVGPVLAAYNGAVYMAWKGMDNDDRLFWSTLSGTTWTPQQWIAGVGSAHGPSLAAFNGRLYAAWRGQFGDESLWYSSFDGHTWAPQHQIPGPASLDGPSLAVFNGRLWAGWRGMFADQSLWYSSFDGTSWTVQDRIPNTWSSIGPALATFNGSLHAVWKGMSSDTRLWFTRFSGWAPQQVIPGVGTGPDVLV